MKSQYFKQLLYESKSNFRAACFRTCNLFHPKEISILTSGFYVNQFSALRDSKAMVVDENENRNKKESTSGKNIPGKEIC